MTTEETRKNEQRVDVLEELLTVLGASITIELSDDLKRIILNQEVGGIWTFPYGLTSTTTRELTFHHPSLQWMWTDKTFCMKFLALHGRYDLGSFQDLQWTLEGPFHSVEETLDDDDDGYRRPPAAVSDSVSSPRMVQTSWKTASFQILGIEFSDFKLSGILSLVDGSSDQWRLNSGAVLTCDEVLLIDKLLNTSQQERTRVAKAMNFLDTYTTPGLIWQNNPFGPHCRLESLGDVLRCAYSYLEDNGR